MIEPESASKLLSSSAVEPVLGGSGGSGRICNWLVYRSGRLCFVKRSLIWRNCYLAPHTEIRGAIIGDCVQVRQGSALFEGVVVGDHSVLEEHCTIKPRVKIWPHKRIASGSIVAESIVWGTKPV